MRALLLVFGLVFYPLAVHALILLEAPRIAVAGLVLTSVGYLAILGAKGGKGVSTLWLSLYGILALFGIFSLYAHSVHVLFVPPVLINLGLLVVFGATLRRGAVPLVERLMRVAYQRELPTGLPQLARRMTWVWVAFFGGMVPLSLGLALWAPLEIWSLFVNVLYYFFVAAVLVAQHAYRHWRFREYGSVSLWRLARNLARMSPRDPAHPFFGAGGEP